MGAAEDADAITLANGDRITGEITRLFARPARTQDRRCRGRSTSRGHRRPRWTTRGLRGRDDDPAASLWRARDPCRSTPSGRRDPDAAAAGGHHPDYADSDGVLGEAEGEVDAGFSYTRSSGIAQANLNGDVRYRRPSSPERVGNADQAGTTTTRPTTARRLSSSMRATAARTGSSPEPRGSKATKALDSTALSDCSGDADQHQHLQNADRGRHRRDGEQGVNTRPTQNLELLAVVHDLLQLPTTVADEPRLLVSYTIRA